MRRGPSWAGAFILEADAGVKAQSNRNNAQATKPRRQQAAGPSFLARLASPFQRLVTFLREVRIEMQRVVWPSRDDTYTYTVVVVVAVVAVAAWVGFWDTIFTQLIAALKLYH